MKKGVRHRRAREAREADHAQRTNTVGGPELPPEFATFAWLLDPERRETMRRRFVDGKGGAMERWVTKFAYSRPLAPEHGIVGMRFMTVEQYMQGEGNRPGPKYLNLPPGVGYDSGPPEAGVKTSGEDLASRLHRAAWELVRDPEYVEALHRRINDGKAPAMERLLAELLDEKSRNPETWRPRKSFCFLSKHPPWLMDPLAERERIMIEAQEAEAVLQARVREEARTKQATAAAAPPDEPSDDEALELYEEP
jgi:hypothetical protein